MVNYDTLIKVSKDQLGRSPTRSLDKESEPLHTQRAFIGILDSIFHDRTFDESIKFPEDTVLEHLYYGFTISLEFAEEQRLVDSFLVKYRQIARSKEKWLYYLSADLKTWRQIISKDRGKIAETLYGLFCKMGLINLWFGIKMDFSTNERNRNNQIDG